MADTEGFVLTEDEHKQVEEGEAASLLLDTPVFLMAIERIRADCAEGILTSDPAATAVREQLYNLSRGLSAVTEELAQMAARAVSITENAALQNPQEDDDVQAEGPDEDGTY